MPPVRRWNPTFTMLVTDDLEGLDGKPLRHVIPGPRTNGIPFAPYAYNGSDFSEPQPEPLKFSRRAARRRGSAPIDPGGFDVTPDLEWWREWMTEFERHP